MEPASHGIAAARRSWVSGRRPPFTRVDSNGYALAFASVLIGWAILSLPWLMGWVAIPYDATAHFFAQLQFLARSIHSGESPFWVPHIFAGSPQIADPQSLIFTPAIILAYLDPTPSLRAFDAYVFLVILAGCLAVVMFFKDRGWHPAAAVVAALTFGFGASASARIQHVGQIHGLVYFMVALWLLTRALDRRSMLHGVLAGAVAALMIAAPGQVQLLGAYFLIGYVLVHWFSAPDWRQEVWRTLMPLMAMGLTTVLLAALPLLFVFLFGTAASRAEIPFAHVTHGSLHPASLLTGAVADLFGANDVTVPYWGPGSGGWRSYSDVLAQNMGQIYFGILPIFGLLAFSAARRGLWRREIRFCTIALICSLIYGLGAYTPFFRVIYEYLPGVQQFRRPADATFFIGVFGALGGGYCLHLFLTDEAKLSQRRLLWIGGTGLAAMLGLALLTALLQGQIGPALKPVLLAGMFVATALGALFVIQHVEEVSPAAAILLLASLTLADLGINNRTNESTGLSSERYAAILPKTRNDTVAFLKSTATALPSDRRDRIALLGIGFDWPNSGLIHGFDHVFGYNPLRLRQIDEALGTGDTVAVPDQLRFPPAFPSYRSTMANMLGLRYLVSPAPIETIDKTLKPGDLTLVKKTQEGLIYENPAALPRVLFVPNWQTADFQALLKTGRWPANFDPRQTVLLHRKPMIPRAPARGVPVIKQPSARLVSYQNTRIEIEVEADKAGFVVLNDVWHPWWFAEVDGLETAVLPANVLFRAVAVAPGRHRVIFTFRPGQGAFKELRAKLSGPKRGATSRWGARPPA